MIVGLRGNSFKNAFHTLSYRFAAIILDFYSRSKGKEIKKYGQGCIADTLTADVLSETKLDAVNRVTSIFG